MRPIKFRGQVIKDGRFVYGDLFQFKSKTAICTDVVSFLYEKKHSALVEVTPESVAQFVGYDADNAEVYEGDVLIDKDGHEYIATLDSMLLWTKDPQIEYWHVPFNQADDDGLPHSSNKLLWDFYKNCCEKMTHTDFLRLKKE